MSSTMSLHEYRLAYPFTAPIPTLTQRRLIGPLLERRQRKLNQAMRRKALRQRIVARLLSALSCVRKLIITCEASDSKSFSEASATHPRLHFSSAPVPITSLVA